MKRIFIFIIAFSLLSCSHWLIETKTRIQVKNSTSDIISDLCIVSKSGKKSILVPGSSESWKENKSKVYEIEWVGEFDFMVYAEDDWKPLGIHKLKGGSVLAEITRENDKFKMTLK